MRDRPFRVHRYLFNEPINRLEYKYRRNKGQQWQLVARKSASITYSSRIHLQKIEQVPLLEDDELKKRRVDLPKSFLSLFLSKKRKKIQTSIYHQFAPQKRSMEYYCWNNREMME